MRKAISPLSSTVLLIAFSVSLGAIAMSWGEGYVEQHAEFVRGAQEIRSGCENVKFEIITLNGKPQFCYTQSILELLVDNGQAMDLYDLHLRVVGEDDIFVKPSALAETVQKGGAVKVKVPYANVGKIKQIKITPKILAGETVIMCDQASQTFENIISCDEM